MRHLTSEAPLLNSGRVAQSATDELELPGFYKVFAVSSCYGTTGHNIENDDDEDGSKTLTKCSEAKVDHKFDLRKEVDAAIDDLGDRCGLEISTKDLDWPSEVSAAFDYLDSSAAARAAFVVTQLAAIILIVIFAVVEIFSPDRFIVTVLTLSIIALISSAIAAGISTSMTHNVVAAVNAAGDDVGISANRGDLFLAITWSGVALLAVSTLIAAMKFCTDTNRHIPKQWRNTPRENLKRILRREAQNQDIALGPQARMSMSMPVQMPMRMSSPMIPPAMPYQYTPMPMQPPMQMPMQAMNMPYGGGYDPYGPQQYFMGPMGRPYGM